MIAFIAQFDEVISMEPDFVLEVMCWTTCVF